MAFPTLAKTYDFNFTNLPGGAVSTVGDDYLFQLVTDMLTLGTNPFTVDYSCDGAVAGVAGDGVNRWIDSGDLVWSTGNHSWIVLENVDGVQILFDLDFSQRYQMIARMSLSGGFSGGTVSSRPTASDETDIVLGSANSWTNNGTYNPSKLWCHASNDGKVFRWFIITDSVCHSWGRVEEVKGAPGAPTLAYAASLFASGNTTTDATDVAQAGDDTDVVRVSGTSQITAQCVLTCQGMEGGVASFAGEPYNEEWTGEAPLMEQGFWSTLTSGARGPKGSAYDIWWTTSPPNSIGTTFPGDGSRQLVSVGHWVIPHDGSVVSL